MKVLYKKLSDNSVYWEVHDDQGKILTNGTAPNRRKAEKASSHAVRVVIPTEKR